MLIAEVNVMTQFRFGRLEQLQLADQPVTDKIFKHEILRQTNILFFFLFPIQVVPASVWLADARNAPRFFWANS